MVDLKYRKLEKIYTAAKAQEIVIPIGILSTMTSKEEIEFFDLKIVILNVTKLSDGTQILHKDNIYMDTEKKLLTITDYVNKRDVVVGTANIIHTRMKCPVVIVTAKLNENIGVETFHVLEDGIDWQEKKFIVATDEYYMKNEFCTFVDAKVVHLEDRQERGKQ